MRLSSLVFFFAAGALIAPAGCAHRVVVTSDPPGLPAAVDGKRLGETPAVMIDDEAYAIHTLTVGEGPEAVTRVVTADKLLSKDAASAALIPLGAACFVPLYWTAGTEDRIHVARSLSGAPLGAGVASPVELEYLPLDARYPHGTATEVQVVDGKPVHVMTDRRPYVTTLGYQGISLPFRGESVAPEGRAMRVRSPALAVGLEQEWLPWPRLGFGASVAYRSWERAVVGDRGVELSSAEVRQAPSLGYREWRTGVLVRYRHPVLRWPKSPGGLDVTVAGGADFVDRFYIDERGGDRWLGGVAPWGEAGFDVGLTRVLAVFVTDRVYPVAGAKPGGPWGSLGAEPGQRVILGARFFW